MAEREHRGLKPFLKVFMATNLASRLSVDTTIADLFAATAEDPEIASIFAGGDKEWIIAGYLGHFLARLVRETARRSILEFGAGTSSLVFAAALAKSGGGCLTSIEHQPEYSRDAWARVEATTGVDAQLVVSPLVLRASRHGLMYGYYEVPAQLLATRAPFDLVLIDAPPGQSGRDSPLYQVYDFLDAGAIVVLDDAGRPAEQTACRRWLDTFPGLQLVHFDLHGRGTAVFRHNGDKRRRVAGRSVLGTVHDRLLQWRRTK